MFSFASPKVWISSPPSLREVETLSRFKKRLKAYYFNSAFEDVTTVDASVLLLIAVELVHLLCINFISVKLSAKLFECYYGP